MSIVTEILEYLEPLQLLDGVNVDGLRQWFTAPGTPSRAPTIDPNDGRPVVGVSEAAALVTALAAHESLLLLSPPGVGKSDIVHQAARSAGMRCQSLLGTQLAPEDLTGVPRIEGGRTVFYPPRVILPDDDQPFCLFLDELPAAAPDVQKAMYSLLLERRLGEHPLPAGSWVVAAGNRVEDAAHVRTLSSALVNRLFVVHVHPTVADWLSWAQTAGVRADVRAFLRFQPEALLRSPTEDGRPFSTPRAWTSLAAALDRLQALGRLDASVRRVLAHGRVSPQDADRYCEHATAVIEPNTGGQYLRGMARLPEPGPARWSALMAVRDAVARGDSATSQARVRKLLSTVDAEERSILLSGLVAEWGAAAGPALLREVLDQYAEELPSDDEDALS